MKLFVNRWLLLTLVVLMIINITVLGTVVFHVLRGERPSHHHEDRGGMPSRKMKQLLHKQIQNDLQLSDEEYKAIEPVLTHFEEQMKQNLDSLRDKQMRLIDVLAEKQVDTLEVRALAVSMGQTQTAMKMSTVRLYLQLKEHCNAEQQQALHRVFKRMMHFNRPFGRGGEGHHRNPPNDMPPPPPMDEE